MIPYEMIWCSPHKLPEKYSSQVSLTQFNNFDEMVFFLKTSFVQEKAKDSSKNVAPDWALAEPLFVVLDASAFVTKSFQNYEFLRKQFPKVKISMIYSKIFDPDKVWELIMETLKPKTVISPTTREQSNLTSAMKPTRKTDSN